MPKHTSRSKSKKRGPASKKKPARSRRAKSAKGDHKAKKRAAHSPPPPPGLRGKKYLPSPKRRAIKRLKKDHLIGAAKVAGIEAGEDASKSDLAYYFQRSGLLGKFLAGGLGLSTSLALMYGAWKLYHKLKESGYSPANSAKIVTDNLESQGVSENLAASTAKNIKEEVEGAETEEEESKQP